MFFSTKKKRSFSKLNAAEKEQRIVSGAFRAVCLHSLVFSTSLCYSRGFFLFPGWVRTLRPKFESNRIKVELCRIEVELVTIDVDLAHPCSLPQLAPSKPKK